MATTDLRKNKSALRLHNNDMCDCNDPEVVEKTCIYREFLDSWVFTPDIGRGKDAGEVFTPRFIVDLMITKGNIVPYDIVYHDNFDDPSDDELRTIIQSTVMEPAVGTGNFSSTILMYKLLSAEELHFRTDEDIEQLLLEAVSSMYASDIDAGNCETTFRRLIGSNDESTISDMESYWVQHIVDLIGENADQEAIEQMVETSLWKAQDSWGEMLQAHKPIVKRFVDKWDVSQEVYAQCQENFRNNLKVFDFIREESTPTIPGMETIWWNQYESGVPVGSKEMLYEHNVAQLQHLQELSEKLASEHKVDDVWQDDGAKKEYLKYAKDIRALEKFFAERQENSAAQ